VPSAARRSVILRPVPVLAKTAYCIGAAIRCKTKFAGDVLA